MSIKTEALEDEGSMHSMETTSPGNPEYVGIYEEWFTAQGVAIMKKARVQPVLEELAKVIKSGYPDVRLDSEPTITLSQGVVGVGVKWNFQDVTQDGKGFMTTRYDEINVMARVATGEIGVTTGKGIIVLDKRQLQTPGVLESALKEASHNPYRVGKAYCYFKNK